MSYAGRRCYWAKSILSSTAYWIGISFVLWTNLACDLRAADWPTLRRDLARSGRADEQVGPPYRVAWTATFDGQMIPTHTEPIVAADRVFIGTYQGGLYCVDASSGERLWKIELPGAILHSPCYWQGTLYVPGVFGLAAVAADSGRILWCFDEPRGGFAASPAVWDGLVLCGARAGTFFAVDAASGAVRWKFPVNAPIRTTAAVANGAVFFAAEDMHVYALDAREGTLRWRSEKLWGQSFRDYGPLVAGGKVIIRSSPVLHFAHHLASDTAFLARQAGLPNNHWQTIDAFLRSDKIRGTPEQIRAEQAAIRQRLAKEPWLKTMFILDAQTGLEATVAPVLYTGGCAGVGNPPAVGPDGRLVVIYRTAYSNFSLGVAPFVGVGLLDVSTGEIEPIFHQHGNQPPWNTFWGTADEAQSITTAGNFVYFCHQGTLSLLDLVSRRLMPVAGKRDSWGGMSNLPGILNEWHGPARSSAVLAGDMIFWQTGSRLLAIKGTHSGQKEQNR